MAGTAARYLYLARHGEASADQSELSAAGLRQATLLGERLRSVPLSAIHHSPLARAAQTARLIRGQLDGVHLEESELVGDYIPYVPERDELPPELADSTLDFVGQFSPEELQSGPPLAQRALAEFTGPIEGNEPRHELVVTHNFVVAWLIRDALEAPKWRWIGLNHANAALTVIRYAPGRPASMLIYNDLGHLPPELRWTGFPAELRV